MPVLTLRSWMNLRALKRWAPRALQDLKSWHRLVCAASSVALLVLGAGTAQAQEVDNHADFDWGNLEWLLGRYRQPVQPNTGGAQPGAEGKAGDATSKQQTPDALLGDWGGLKSTLAGDGIKFSIGYKGEFAANLSGGDRHDATESGQTAFSGTADTGKLFGLTGGTIQATITYRNGHDLGERAGLGVLQQVQEVYGRGQTWRLTELWYQQVLANGHVAIKVGRVPAGDFNTFDCKFMNLTFCGSQAGNLLGYFWYNYPISQWTGWIKLRNDTMYVKVGAHEDNRNNLDNAFFISRGGARGVVVNGEAGWTPSFGGGKLPGHYHVGGWWLSSQDPDVLLDLAYQPASITGRPALLRGGQYGVYVQGQQQITGSATIDPVSDVITHQRGLAAFFNVTRGDPRTATQLDQETIGLYLYAPFAKRPLDRIGFAVGRTAYNGRAARALEYATPGIEKPRAEYASELFYAAAVIPGLTLRPNLQYIANPGGYDDRKAIVIIGTRFDITL